MADAAFPNERTRNAYVAENFLPLVNLCADRVAKVASCALLSGDTRVTAEVRVKVTPGHTRRHQVVIVESAGETGVFLGDAGYRANLERLAWVPAFDVEPLHSMETKRALRDWAWRQNALLFFQHDSAMPAGRAARRGRELARGSG